MSYWFTRDEIKPVPMASAVYHGHKQYWHESNFLSIVGISSLTKRVEIVRYSSNWIPHSTFYHLYSTKHCFLRYR